MLCCSTYSHFNASVECDVWLRSSRPYTDVPLCCCTTLPAFITLSIMYSTWQGSRGMMGSIMRKKSHYSAFRDWDCPFYTMHTLSNMDQGVIQLQYCKREGDIIQQCRAYEPAAVVNIMPYYPTFDRGKSKSSLLWCSSNSSIISGGVLKIFA